MHQHAMYRYSGRTCTNMALCVLPNMSLEDALVASVRRARAEPETLAHEAAARYGYPAGFCLSSAPTPPSTGCLGITILSPNGISTTLVSKVTTV